MGKTVEVELDFFKHLLNCASGTQAQETVNQALKEGTEIVASATKPEVYLRKLREIWDEATIYIVKKIKFVADLNDKGLLKSDIVDYHFKWTLVKQECEMYCMLGEMINPKEFKNLCKCRGFDDNMKQLLINIMKYIGIGDRL